MFRKKTEGPTIRNLDGTEPKVEWVTALPGLVEAWPIIPARRALPEWFKESDTRVSPQAAHGQQPGQHGQHGQEPPMTGTVVGPKTYSREHKPTIRSCPGVIDVMRSGYLLRAWTDIEITTQGPPAGATDTFRAVTALRPDELGGKIGAFAPPLNQKIPLYPGEYDFALKFDTPWACKTPPGWSLSYAPVPYAEQRPYRLLPGVVDNDEFHVVNLIIMWSHHGRYLIEAGTPLCWLTPVKREGFNMPTDVVFDPERHAQLVAAGKGGVGKDGGRLIHGAYVLERAKSRKQR